MKEDVLNEAFAKESQLDGTHPWRTDRKLFSVKDCMNLIGISWEKSVYLEELQEDK